MKALISPEENNRIAQVEEVEFPVSLPLYWIDCPENCTTHCKYIDGEFVEFLDIP